MPITHKHLAELCRDSYLEAGPAGTVAEIGGLGPKCFVVEPDDSNSPTVLVFRGTADRTGWIEDLLADFVTSVNDAPEVKRHRGFFECWLAIDRQVKKAVGLRPVIITGHSLGAAIATQAAMELPGVVSLVTFGSPRVGNAAFAEAFASHHIMHTRYVRDLDPVPWVPGWLAGYRHVCPATWYDGEKWGAFDWIAAAQHAVRWWQVSRDRLWVDHEIAKYLEAMQ